VKYLLDTDTFSEMARGRNPALEAHLAHRSLADMALSAITVGEVQFGLLGLPLATRLLARTRELLAGIACLSVDQAVALRYGEVRAYLARSGQPIGPNDHWIAAHASSLDLTLVTGNIGEFSRVPKLRLENWLR